MTNRLIITVLSLIIVSVLIFNTYGSQYGGADVGPVAPPATAVAPPPAPVAPVAPPPATVAPPATATTVAPPPATVPVSPSPSFTFTCSSYCSPSGCL